jgi:hypothetical protein
MGLITHPALQGHLRQGCLRRYHEFLSSLHAALGDIAIRGLTKRPTKDAKEMTRAQSYDTREVAGSDGRVEPIVDVRSQTLDLPGCEAALQIRMLRSGNPCRAQVDSEQCCGVLDASLRHPAVGVQCARRGGQEARQHVVARAHGCPFRFATLARSVGAERVTRNPSLSCSKVTAASVLSSVAV